MKILKEKYGTKLLLLHNTALQLILHKDPTIRHHLDWERKMNTVGQTPEECKTLFLWYKSDISFESRVTLLSLHFSWKHSVLWYITESNTLETSKGNVRDRLIFITDQ